MDEILTKTSFRDFLVEKGELQPDVARRLQEEYSGSKKSIVDIVLAKGLLDEIKLRDLLAEYTGLRVGDVPFGLSQKTFKFLDFKNCYRYRIVTYDVGDDLVRIATDNPLNLEMREVVDFLERARGIKIELYVVTKSELIQLLNNYTQGLLDNQEVGAEQINNLKETYGEIYTEVSQAPILTKEEQEKAKELEDQIKDQAKAAPQQESSLEMRAAAETRAQEVKEMGLMEDSYSAEQKSWLKMLQEKVESVEQLEKIINSRDIPRMVAAFVHYAIYTKASDIHIEPMTNKIRVRYRIDGVLQEVIEMEKNLLPALVSRIKILALLKIDEHRIPQDGQFRVTFESRMVDLRISMLPTVYGEKVVIRILDVSSGRLTLDQLGIQGMTKQKVERNIKRSNGMILSTGPTGSGKSTTLFSILGIVSTPGVNVITLEDPVEYHIPGVNQVQTRPDIGFTFATGLRSILRQDPNIVMVGEIRDGETAELAVHASLTGHLVLSTLHTNDAPSAIPRLIDMGIEPFLITSSLVLVMAQRLCRKICDHCRSQIELPVEKAQEIKQYLVNVPEEHIKLVNVDLNKMKFSKGLGCDYCKDTGYKGRIGVYEALEMSEQLQELALKKASGVDIFEKAVEEGMITMRQDAFLKALQGMTTLDEVYRVTTK
ncbi:type II/IV secretion system protein [Patescibacteria group bacterium]|nr:type II/IV secretion system protein [Patescibacteria group bacterium]